MAIKNKRKKGNLEKKDRATLEQMLIHTPEMLLDGIQELQFILIKLDNSIKKKRPLNAAFFH